RVLINSSATGYYGNTGDNPADESGKPGYDFLAKLAQSWEAQALRAEHLGLRVVMLRMGIVLDNRGGARMQMRQPFDWDVGGPVGSGKQYMPWIHWRDLLGLIDLALERTELQGPINAVAPQQITNRTFARALGNVLAKPSGLPVPKFVVRLAFGEIAESI